jgi:hypothetical protein
LPPSIPPVLVTKKLNVVTGVSGSAEASISAASGVPGF